MKLLLLLHYLVYRRSSNRDLIDADLNRWVEQHNIKKNAFIKAMSTYPAFRSLFYYRTPNSPFIRILRLLYPGEKTLRIFAKEIGPGLYIQHGQNTTIGGYIGSGCWINQNCSMAYTKHGLPTIGDDVFIFLGSNIVGPVKIGDRVKVGAGTTVVKDIPSDCTVVSSENRIIPHRNR
ncbi:MAG: serine acetyltransferase [Desulfobacteraceae bacterium]|nr:serine acetyltransferase [Desulfobacteraceae bacterium]